MTRVTSAGIRPCGNDIGMKMGFNFINFSGVETTNQPTILKWSIFVWWERNGDPFFNLTSQEIPPKDWSIDSLLEILTPWKMNGWLTYKSPMKRKEKMIDSPKTSMVWHVPAVKIFRGYAHQNEAKTHWKIGRNTGGKYIRLPVPSNVQLRTCCIFLVAINSMTPPPNTLYTLW